MYNHEEALCAPQQRHGLHHTTPTFPRIEVLREEESLWESKESCAATSTGVLEQRQSLKQLLVQGEKEKENHIPNSRRHIDSKGAH